MSSYAVIQTGGKQYMVRPGDKLKVERLPGKGEKIELDTVLAISDGETLSRMAPQLITRK